ncbi:MAG: NTP transferase domain-containing protein [Sphingomonadales bacterium]
MHWIILAGSRSNSDPIAQMGGEPFKALVKVAGVPMLERVVRTLFSLDGLSRISILLQDDEPLQSRPEWHWLRQDERVHIIRSRGSASQALLDVMENGAAEWPTFITTADNVMLTPSIARQFIQGAVEGETEFAFATVREHEVRAAVPDTKRTYWKFADGGFATCNLFALTGPQSLEALRLWRMVEQDRKKVWKIVAAFGILPLIGYRLGLLSFGGGLARASKKLDVKVKAVALDDARACIDVDKPEDFVLTERLLSAAAHV